MTYCVTLLNHQLNKVAEDCGLVVDPLNQHITQSEICFFGERVVRECILTIMEQKPNVGDTKIYNDLAKVLWDKFGVTM